METGIHELTAGYALDALDPEERQAYEAHLAGCERCRAELHELQEATAALAVATSGPAPCPSLRDRILDAVQAEPPQPIPLEARRRRGMPLLGAAATAAAVAALALGLWAADLAGELDDTRSALARERTTAAILADPGARSIALDAGEGRLVVAPDGRAVLVLDDLDPAPAGKTYQAWIVEGETPVSAGIFQAGEGRDLVPVEGAVEGGEVVAVTLEEAGGAETPTLPPLVASERV